jgi:hypothetical protein
VIAVSAVGPAAMAQDIRIRSSTAVPVAPSVPWEDASLALLTADPRMEALVRGLDASSFDERRASTEALLDRSIPDAQVWLRLSRGGLSTEAHRRLLWIGQSRIMNAPRGALGIQMAGRFGDVDGVTVTALIPNMPARKVLQPGDRIVAIDGQSISVSQQLTNIVQLKRPGETIRLTVMRGERDAEGRVVGGPDGRPLEHRLEVDMEVGSYDDLSRFGDPGMASTLVDTGRERQAERLAAAFPVPREALALERLPGEEIGVDSHPDIAQLRAQLARPGGLGDAPAVRAILQARLSSLEAAARIPGLDPEERAWFQAVADRYRELIPEGLRARTSP